MLDYQSSLPGLLTSGERGYLANLTENPAYLFTVKVQPSWCAGRSAKAAYLTLSVLAGEIRDSLLEEWISSGGGTHSLSGAESADFLTFIASRLVEPSHELTICRMELAALQSSEGSLSFGRPAQHPMDRPDRLLRRGCYAGVVHFYAEPEQVLKAFANGKPSPPISSDTTTLIFGPGFDRLYTTASVREAALYDRLESPVSAAQLFSEGFSPETIQRLLDGGALEYVE